MTLEEYLTSRGFTKTSLEPTTFSGMIRRRSSMVVNGQPIESPPIEVAVAYLGNGTIDEIGIQGWRLSVNSETVLDIWDYTDDDWVKTFNGIL